MTASASRFSAIAPPPAAAAPAVAGQVGREGREGDFPHHLAGKGTVPYFSVPAADHSCPEVDLGTKHHIMQLSSFYNIVFAHVIT